MRSEWEPDWRRMVQTCPAQQYPSDDGADNVGVAIVPAECLDVHDIRLILESDAAHTCGDVRELEDELRVHPPFHSLGPTHLLGPLDRSVWRALKA